MYLMMKAITMVMALVLDPARQERPDDTSDLTPRQPMAAS
jgi:hypothetical protein